VLGYLTWLKLFEDEAIGGRPLLVLGALAFVTGLMFVMVGLLAEMLVRIYHESQGKATYVVKEMPPVEQPERDRERVAPGR
jgi:dolichol-phosphate mannosyltransferase